MSADPRRERLDELLCDRALVGLSPQEERELAQLLAATGANEMEHELAAAALDGALAPHDEELPPALRARLEAAARSFAATSNEPSPPRALPAAPRRSPPVQAQPQPAAVTGPPPAATAASTGTAAPRTTPIQTNPVRRPPSTATPASTRPAPAARPALVLPNTSGAGTSPLEAEQTPPESVNAGAGLEAVRRERAGPDQ